ncbi:prepilin peptidase [Candidatus Woesearchaeota archaeon]|nr:prepilin peptidase [Candidatus Woesearchaeota archaeon]
MLEAVLIVVALVLCAFASVTDLKTREVPDWLNYGGIIFGLGSHAIVSLLQWNVWLIVDSIAGLLLGVALGCLMYYTGQWGGGDSKLVMALGALIGFSPAVTGDLRQVFESVVGDRFFSVLVWSMIAGTVYSLVWTAVLAVKHRKQVVQELAEMVSAPGVRLLRKVLLASLVVGVLVQFVASDVLVRLMLGLLLIMVPLLMYLFWGIRAVERCCMIKWVRPAEVTEGDWIAQDIIVAKKRISGPKDLGITLEQLDLLQKLARQGKVKKVLVKYGIPFVPSFLMGLILALLVQNPMMWVL